MVQNDGAPHDAVGWLECEPAALAWHGGRFQLPQPLFGDEPRDASTMLPF